MQVVPALAKPWPPGALVTTAASDWAAPCARKQEQLMVVVSSGTWQFRGQHVYRVATQTSWTEAQGGCMHAAGCACHRHSQNGMRAKACQQQQQQESPRSAYRAGNGGSGRPQGRVGAWDGRGDGGGSSLQPGLRRGKHKAKDSAAAFCTVIWAALGGS